MSCNGVESLCEYASTALLTSKEELYPLWATHEWARVYEGLSPVTMPRDEIVSQKLTVVASYLRDPQAMKKVVLCTAPRWRSRIRDAFAKQRQTQPRHSARSAQICKFPSRELPSGEWFGGATKCFIPYWQDRFGSRRNTRELGSIALIIAWKLTGARWTGCIILWSKCHKWKIFRVLFQIVWTDEEKPWLLRWLENLEI